MPCAFHVHSPASHDWGKSGDQADRDLADLTGDEALDAFLDALVAADLRLVCVTDHMKSAHAAALSRRAQTRDDITVLPGMEVSCLIPPGKAERVHLLVAFPEGTGADVIERIFAKQKELPGEAERGGEEVAKIDSLTEWRELITDQGGLLILAHVDQHPRGHRAFIRRTRADSLEMFGGDPADEDEIRAISHEYAQHLVDLHPDAVEVMKSADRDHYVSFTTPDEHSHSYACVARSDLHTLVSFAEADVHTHVKVSRVDFECARRALRFHDTRIRFSDDIPAAPTPRIVGLQITSPSGLFKEATIAFNENLNTLIGSRGSGKSTVVEALRYVLGQRPRLDEPAGSTAEDRSFAALALATQNANLIDAEIELIYESEGERRLLRATFDPDQGVATRAFLPDGTDLQIESAALPAAFPARIFSWSELETLGRNPNLQRSVIDRLTDSLPELFEHRTNARHDLALNRNSAAELLRQLDDLFTADEAALNRYAEFKLNYERLNTPQVAALFTELDALRERIRVLKQLDSELATFAGQLADLVPERPASALSALLAEASDGLREFWAEQIAPKIDLDSLAQGIEQNVEEMQSQISERRASLASELQVQSDMERQREEALREQTDADAESQVQSDQRESARRRYERSASLRRQYKEIFAELSERLAERDQFLIALRDVSTEITTTREATGAGLGERLKEIERPGEPAVSISVEADGDRQPLTSWLQDEFLDPNRGGHYRQKKLAPRLASVDPSTIAGAIVAGNATPLIGGNALSVEEAERLLGAFEVLHEDPAAQVTRVSDQLIELLRLQEVPLDDAITIYSGDTPVHRLSPGGRSSAMLPLIALSDRAPLIIDQPEDNLDNRMVGITLSSILARLKERRQIIVTTHNPNIVVGGDAEQVVVLDAPAVDEAEVELTGSIDDDDVIDAVIRIMEGGKEAFEVRERRYESHLQAP